MIVKIAPLPCQAGSGPQLETAWLPRTTRGQSVLSMSPKVGGGDLMYHKLQGSNHVLKNTWSKVGGRSILERTLFMKESTATNLFTSPTSSSSLPVPPWAPFPLPNLVNLATWNSTSATTLPTLPSNSLRLPIVKCQN